MALPKVCGIETEYGVTSRSGTVDPVTASSRLINAYVSATSLSVGWDFQDETPANDARGIELDALFAPAVESHLVNTVLTNGARYYVDHAHPEISIPEVRTAREAVIWDRAADQIMVASMREATAFLDGDELIVHKNNSDGKGNSYGCHENYLVDRSVPFARVAAQVTPHFVTRQVFCGAGKVGTERGDEDPHSVPFQISQRADFFEEPIGLETTVKRPIVNTRDEPHCNPELYRRLHVIVGDANMSEVATYLKVGTTAFVLAMIEDDQVGDDLNVAEPVEALVAISRDPSLSAIVRLADGRTITALELQFALLERAYAYAQTHGLEAVGEEVGHDVLERWSQVLVGLESDPNDVADVVDWAAKKRLIDGYAHRHGLGDAHLRLRAVDLQYHDLRPDRCLAARAGLKTLVDPAAVDDAMVSPPASTRAYFRGRCLDKFGDQVMVANWDSMVFEVDGEPLKRVPMMEPLRGTAEHVAKVIDESSTIDELLLRLGQ